MLYIESDNTIRLTRGDTARITVTIENEIDETTYEIDDTDVIYFTVKKSTKDATPLFQKMITGGEDTFHIKPEDTNGLPYGRYRYDVQLTLKNGDIYTVIEPSTFEVMHEVTY